MTHLQMPTASQVHASRDSLENWEQRGSPCPEICLPLQDAYWLTGKGFLCHFDGSPVVHGINSENAAERHCFSLSQTDYSTVHLRFCPKSHHWAWHPVPQHNFESADLMLISDAFLSNWRISVCLLRESSFTHLAGSLLRARYGEEMKFPTDTFWGFRNSKI